MIYILPMKMNVEEILGRTKLFANITAEHRKDLAAICRTKSVLKKRHLFFENDKGTSVYILITGSIQLYKTANDGKEVVIRVIKPGEMFGEVILFEQDHYPVSAVTLRDSNLILLSKQQFSSLLSQEDFRSDFFGTLMKKMRYLTERISYLTLHDVEERLRSFLEDHYGKESSITPTISKKDTAFSIGATPETFSRLLKKLAKEKRLHWEKGSIVVSEEFWKSVD